MINANTKHKDSVFTDLFYSDQNAQENLDELYNALYGYSVLSSDIIRLRLDDAIFMNYHNDVAFSVRQRHIVLCEHQSTINNNIPLRCLLYIAREYESYFPVEVRYKRKLVKIPTPEFYVFYNGTEDYPVESFMKLSDAFTVRSDSSISTGSSLLFSFDRRRTSGYKTLITTKCSQPAEARSFVLSPLPARVLSYQRPAYGSDLLTHGSLVPP